VQLVIDRETYKSGTESGSKFVISYQFCPNRDAFAKAGNLLAKALVDLNRELLKDARALHGLLTEESNLPSPTGPVMLEDVIATSKVGLEMGPFVKPSKPAEPQEVVCETPERTKPVWVAPGIIVAKQDQVEDAKKIIQAEGSDIVAEVVSKQAAIAMVSEPATEIAHAEPEEPEAPEKSEKDILTEEFEDRCFREVTSPETAAKLWEEYKVRITAYGDPYRKTRATSLVMAVVDHNEGLTVPEAGALIQAEVKKLAAPPAEKTPESPQTETPEDITPLVQSFLEALKEFESKPNVSESELFRLLAVTCATPLPDRKVNPNKAFAVLDGAVTLHKVPMLLKVFPDMAATKEKIVGDASKTKKFTMMCAAAKIQIER